MILRLEVLRCRDNLWYLLISFENPESSISVFSGIVAHFLVMCIQVNLELNLHNK